MSTWSYNINFPGFLYKKVTNLDEYYTSIIDLLNPIDVKALIFGEIFSGTIYPLDIDEWNDIFNKENHSKNKLDLNYSNVSLKPNEDEFPLLLQFSSNHKYFFWIPLSNIE